MLQREKKREKKRFLSPIINVALCVFSHIFQPRLTRRHKKREFKRDKNTINTTIFLYETRFTFFLRYAHDTHTRAIKPIFAFFFFAVVVCASFL